MPAARIARIPHPLASADAARLADFAAIAVDAIFAFLAAGPTAGERGS
jgi:hypothetical protein